MSGDTVAPVERNQNFAGPAETVRAGKKRGPGGTRPVPERSGIERSISIVMLLNVVRFCALFFTALTLAPALAHVFELPHKISLPAQEYLIVQQIYRGWDLLGLPVLLALASNAALTVLLARRREPFALPLTATSAIVASQVIFWVFTYPVNRATENWTTLPQQWMQLRARWEFSHAVGAACDLVAFVVLIVALLPRRA